jgi:hypothetical protein
MHVIPPYEAGVTLFHYNGTKQLFASRRALFEHLGWRCLCRELGEYFDPSRWTYVAREAGLVLSLAAFVVFRQSVTSGGSPQRLLSGYLHREELRSRAVSGPVPGIHRRRFGGHYRIPATFTERRANALVDQEAGEPPVRSSRRWKNLPSSWDDMVRSDHNTRSWKKHRKHQWKD